MSFRIDRLTFPRHFVIGGGMPERVRKRNFIRRSNMVGILCLVGDFA